MKQLAEHSKSTLRVKRLLKQLCGELSVTNSEQAEGC